MVNAKKPTWKQRAETAESDVEELKAKALEWYRMASVWRERAQQRDDEIVELKARMAPPQSIVVAPDETDEDNDKG